jgi:hypothetical protein
MSNNTIIFLICESILFLLYLIVRTIEVCRKLIHNTRKEGRAIGCPTSMQRKQTIMITRNKARFIYLDFPLKWSKVPFFDLVVAPSSNTPEKIPTILAIS